VRTWPATATLPEGVLRR